MSVNAVAKEIPMSTNCPGPFSSSFETFLMGGPVKKKRNLVPMSTSGRSFSDNGLWRRTKTQIGCSKNPTTPSSTMTASEPLAIFFCNATLTFPSPKVDN